MKITRIETFRVHVPSKGDYRMATGVHSGLRSLIVKLHNDAGIVGVGEGHQGIAGYSAETVETMQSVVDRVYAPALVGRELAAPEALAAEVAVARMGNRFARCALETALYDALARANKTNVATLLGGPVRRQLQLSGSIGIDDPDKMAAKAAAMVAAGYRTVKVKIGTSDIALDLKRVREVRRAVGDEVAIRIDANAGYPFTEAMMVVRGIADLNIEHLEQPVAADQWDQMARLTAFGAVPILADESVHSPEDVYRMIRAGAADAIKIKISKVGGYIAARKIIDITEAAGIRLVIGQGICSSIEAAAEAQLACAYPHVYPVAEMVGPTKLNGDLADPALDLSKGVLDLPEGPGIGVQLSDRLLKQFLVADGVETQARAA
jgi:muconate cycloisomerase